MQIQTVLQILDAAESSKLLFELFIRIQITINVDNFNALRAVLEDIIDRNKNIPSKAVMEVVLLEMIPIYLCQ